MNSNSLYLVLQVLFTDLSGLICARPVWRGWGAVGTLAPLPHGVIDCPGSLSRWTAVVSTGMILQVTSLEPHVTDLGIMSTSVDFRVTNHTAET